jgi:hypothetical protein
VNHLKQLERLGPGEWVPIRSNQLQEDEVVQYQTDAIVARMHASVNNGQRMAFAVK